MSSCIGQHSPYFFNQISPVRNYIYQSFESGRTVGKVIKIWCQENLKENNPYLQGWKKIKKYKG